MSHHSCTTVLTAMLFSVGAQAASLTPSSTSIHEICGAYRDIQKIKSFEELERSIISVCLHYEHKQSIVDLTSDALDVLRLYSKDENPDDESSRDPNKIAQREKLMSALKRLSDGVAIETRTPTPTTSPSPLALKLRELKDKYSPDSTYAKDMKAKGQDAYNKEYLGKIKEVLGLTKVGKKALDCWAKYKSAPFSGEEFVAVTPDAKGNLSGPTAMFVTRSANAKGGALAVMDSKSYVPAGTDTKNMYVKRIIFNPSSDPIELVHILGHEMIHSCSALEDVTDKKRFQEGEAKMDDCMKRFCSDPAKDPQGRSTCPPSLFTSAEYQKIEQDNKNIRRVKEQNGLVDECRAYSAQVELYKEIAQADSGLVCNHNYVSGAFDAQVITSGEFQSATERSLLDGSFALQIAREYSDPLKGGSNKPESFFQDPGPNDPKAKLLPDLVQKLKAAGCPLPAETASGPAPASK